MLKELSPEGEYNVILDMTHGFRTMPTVMSFSIMLVQTLRKIENIDIYYGAFDMMDSLGRTPVLKIDFVNKLSKFTQALSIYQNTGYFVQLLKEVDYPEDRGKDLHFKLEMNRRVKKQVEEIINHLDSFSDYRREICLPLKKDLENVIKTKRLHGRMIEKAKKLFEQKQYLKALILLYEGLILCGNDIFNKNKEIKHKDEQLNIRNEIKKYFDKQGLENYSKDLQTITEVRNSVVHGNDKQQQYLENENKFIQLFNKGIEIYEILSKAIV
ncbi:CRISPR-associated DxTHG motif protein [Anaerobranca californiensis DSM 14826]|uniref:CRISPR-associated DxTHG motif protein n=1 Tax=Anaerobranca californiensis DSM 14826 TaxID=1120989 RepID=A0A1M6QK39_9FIRM|nr:TM1812 family CRISPR-associated protein [Anaerobranca californiensis]SHK20601.1 CRISPR-associated DxTHG motif protein [Anaerobranca californiensis DSM 14826]